MNASMSWTVLMTVVRLSGPSLVVAAQGSRQTTRGFELKALLKALFSLSHAQSKLKNRVVL